MRYRTVSLPSVYADGSSCIAVRALPTTQDRNFKMRQRGITHIDTSLSGASYFEKRVPQTDPPLQSLRLWWPVGIMFENLCISAYFKTSAIGEWKPTFCGVKLLALASLKGKQMPTESQLPSPSNFYPDLLVYLEARQAEFDLIPEDRKADLAKVADYARERLSRSELAKLTFICTHNSRRSHLSQIWAQVGAEFYGLSGVETYSGGTEATAFNPRAVAALRRCGLKIVADVPEASNPRYSVFVSDKARPQTCFSKVYDAPPNPKSEFCAIMTCSEADKACPLVRGCEVRIPIRYEDPKAADNTNEESQRYDERSAQICREMLYIMSAV